MFKKKKKLAVPCFSYGYLVFKLFLKLKYHFHIPLKVCGCAYLEVNES